MTGGMRKTLRSIQPFHRTPLHWAVACRNECALRTMLDAGADWQFVDRDGTSVLQYAVLFGTKGMVASLLALEVPGRTALTAWTPECNLITVAVQRPYNSDYVPGWWWNAQHILRPVDLYQQRAANVDTILKATRGLWTAEDLEEWLQAAEKPHVPEVVEIVQQHVRYLRWSTQRHVWLRAVVGVAAFLQQHT